MHITDECFNHVSGEDVALHLQVRLQLRHDGAGWKLRHAVVLNPLNPAPQPLHSSLLLG